VSEMWAETEALAADLAAAGVRLAVLLPPVVSKGALNIKNDWRASLSGLPHLPHLPAAISYDMDVKPDAVSAEIGPDKDKKQGPLGSIVEFGTSKNPPRLDGARALTTEAPKFEAACEAVAEQALLG